MVSDLNTILKEVLGSGTQVRVGVFGGSFDPVHIGHLINARAVLEEVGLDWVLFVPALLPPHKEGTFFTADERFRMLSDAVRDEPGFAVSDIELMRPGPSYTIDTLREIRTRLAIENEKHDESFSGVQETSGSEIALIIGVDSLLEMESWKEPEAIYREFTLLVARRSHPVNSEPPEWSRNRAVFIDTPLIDISSTGIRERLEASRSIHYLVPEVIESYIDDVMARRHGS